MFLKEEMCVVGVLLLFFYLVNQELGGYISRIDFSWEGGEEELEVPSPNIDENISSIYKKS